MDTARKYIRFLIPLAALAFLFSCSSNDVVDSSVIAESYSDYRDGNKKAMNNLISYYRDPSVPKDLRKDALM